MANIHLGLAKYAHFVLNSEQTYFKLNIENKNNVFAQDSRLFGGSCFDCPKDKNNQDMYFIAQINFEDIKYSDLFPQNGILQFFYSTVNNNSFVDIESKIVYRETFYENKEPIDGSYRLSFNRGSQFCPVVDKYGSSFYYNSFIQNLSEKELDIFENTEEFNSFGSKVGGYPAFYNKDFREEEYDFDNPLILLLQLDCNKSSELNSFFKEISIANWFIRKNDLLNKDFSKIIYNFEKKQSLQM